MKIEFVNHSSFVIEHNGIRIICDPWLDGTVFNNGWNLIAKSKFSYEDFENIDYIWFSHEHPDHFSPPNLLKINPRLREKITVLFQHTLDKRVVEFCKKQKFKEVIELCPNQWQKIGDDFELLCEPFIEGDSWICFKAGEKVILNTNDCAIEKEWEVNNILEKIGGKVDMLLAQFSYAYWAGNPEDKDLRKQVADTKLELLKLQCDIFKSEFTAPIASYVYFSHIENFYLNDTINTPRKAFDFIEGNTESKPLIFYPGDAFEFGKSHNSIKSIEDYEKDFEKIQLESTYQMTQSVDSEKLTNEALSFIKKIKSENWFYLKTQLKPTNVFIKDFNCSYCLSLNGFRKTDLAEEMCDVILTSENLEFCFCNSYGLDTTQINGRLRRPRSGNYRNFYNFFRINQLKNRGINPNNLMFLMAAVYRRLFSKEDLHELMK